MNRVPASVVAPVWDACSDISRADENPDPRHPQPVQGVLLMSTVEKSIDVNVPISTAYNQWTQFEEFPHFMEGVKSVRQLDDKRLHWKTQIAGKEVDFDAVIDQQVPDQRIAWHSTIGPTQGGGVTFHRLGDDKTRIML